MCPYGLHDMTERVTFHREVLHFLITGGDYFHQQRGELTKERNFLRGLETPIPWHLGPAVHASDPTLQSSALVQAMMPIAELERL